MAKAVFLDRDETLNPDPGYIHHPDLFDLFPWVAPELKKLKDAGFLLIIVTNQSGLGRGLIQWDSLNAIHAKMDQLLYSAAQIKIDGYQICPHRPDEDCGCRKPHPQLILDALQTHGIDPKQSYMIGDRASDYEAGVRAGLKQSFQIPSGNEEAFKKAIAEILKSEAR